MLYNSQPNSPDTGLTVRDYRSSDYDQIITLWEQTALGDRKRGDINDIILDTIKKGGKLLVLEKEKKSMIIGTSWMTNDGRRIHLHHFCVKNDYQGRGYAKILLDASLEFVKSTGLQVKIEVEQTNIKAISLYKNYGFKYLGDYDVYIIRNIDDINLTS